MENHVILINVTVRYLSDNLVACDQCCFYGPEMNCGDLPFECPATETQNACWILSNVTN